MDKFEKAFAHKANIGYVVAGYPNLNYTRDFINSLDGSALDLLEIGIPYSDPMADGKLISVASFHAVKAGVTTDSVFDMLATTKTSKCLVFLVYYNLIFAYGEDKFLSRAKEVGIDGLIVPDMPFEESEEFRAKCDALGLALVPLVSVTSGERAEKIAAAASGFIYVVGTLGVTGGCQEPVARVKTLVSNLKKHTSLPLAVGFGIKTNSDVRNAKSYADGAIVGTRIVDWTTNLSVEELNREIAELFKD